MTSTLDTSDSILTKKKFYYNNQQNAATAIVDSMVNGNRNVLLIAEPQQGKTGVAFCVMDQFIERMRNGGIKKEEYEIFYINNVGENVLVEKNIDEAINYGFVTTDKRHEKYITIDNHFSYKELQINPSVKYRLLIVDEVHVALGKDKPFHNFCQKLNIQYEAASTEWKDSNDFEGTGINFVLSISATPYAHVLTNKQNPLEVFEIVTLEKTDHYYSISNLLDNKRIHQSEKLFKNEEISEFLENRLQEFNKNDNGVLMMRCANANKADELRDLIIKKFKEYENGIFIFSSYWADKNRNHLKLSDLDRYLKGQDKSTYKSIFIFVQSLRLGQTLCSTKNIKMWIETSDSNSDTTAQAGPGRCCGYITEDDKESGHSKFKDTFPIYCDRESLIYAAGFYKDTYENIPKGIINTKDGTFSKKQKIAISTLIKKEDLQSYANKEEIEQCLKNIGYDIKMTRNVSDNPSRNIFSDILLEKKVLKDAAYPYLIYVDKLVSNEIHKQKVIDNKNVMTTSYSYLEYISFYEKVKDKYNDGNDLIGNYILVEQKDGTSYFKEEGKFKKGSIFSNE